MLTDYALQTIYGSSLYNNGPLVRNSNLYDTVSIRDNYGYQRGSVDYMGRVTDSNGNLTGLNYNKGTFNDSFGSTIGSVGSCNRIINNLGQDSGYSIANSYTKRYDDSRDTILSGLTSRQYDYQSKPFGMYGSCEICGQVRGHAMWCSKKY